MTLVKTGVPKQPGIKKAFLMLGLAAVASFGGMAEAAAADVEEGGGGQVVSFSFSAGHGFYFPAIRLYDCFGRVHSLFARPFALLLVSYLIEKDEKIQYLPS
jgi:hypothetical protein